MFSRLHQQSEVSGHLQAPAAILRGKGWDRRVGYPVWTIGISNNSYPYLECNADPSEIQPTASRQLLATIPTELLWSKRDLCP
jgi:hypothetical protein